MNTVDGSTLLTTIFVLVDDWYQPKAFEGLLNSLREGFEGVFHEVQNTGRNLERLLRKKVDGICLHVAAKITSHTLRIFLRQRFGIDVLTFEQHPVA
ncbi:MAG: hypothetical protein V7K72_05005 [Nostoc sp.]